MGYCPLMSAITDTQRPYGPWNPGVLSQMPKELRSLATIFRPENVTTSVAAADELRGLTGFAHSELVVFRPQRLALHELLIRVTADFAVPDGSRIGDLGINFREIAGRLLALHLVPQMDAIMQAFDQARGQVSEAVEAALCAVVPAFAPGGARMPAPAAQKQRRLFGLLADRRPSPAHARAGSAWGPAQIAECERRATAAPDALQRLAHQTVARVLSALFTAHGHAVGHSRAHRVAGGGSRRQPLRQRCDRPNHRPDIAARGATGGLWAAAAPGPARRHQYQGALRLGQEHAAPAAEETRGRDRRRLERLRADQPGHLAQAAARLRLARHGL